MFIVPGCEGYRDCCVVSLQGTLPLDAISVPLLILNIVHLFNKVKGRDAIQHSQRQASQQSYQYWNVEDERCQRVSLAAPSIHCIGRDVSILSMYAVQG